MLKLITILIMISAALAQYEGTRFLVTFPPQSIDSNAGLCQIIINTNTRAEVSIQTHDNTDHITVDVGSYIYDLPYTMRAPIGFSNKGVIVDSDVDISVQVFSMLTAVGDAYLALPVRSQGGEYIVASTVTPCGGEGSVDNFYTVAAEQDGTVVDLYIPVSGGYALVSTWRLDRFQTTTNGSYVGFMGWKFHSSSPISVVSGAACSKIHTSSSCNAANSEYLYSPSLDQAGRKFIVPKITKQNPGNSGAYIRVISFSENNLIQLPDQSTQETIHSGQFFQHYINPYDEITRIECRYDCMVILFNEVACVTGEGGFLLYVTPIDRGTESVRFSAIERAADGVVLANYLTIIANTQNVFLDGVAITDWRFIPGWNYFDTAIPVTHGGHTLETFDGGKFAAYVYGHYIYFQSSWGYGTEIVHGAPSDADDS